MRCEGIDACAQFNIVLTADLRSFPADGPINYADSATGRVDWLDNTGTWRSRTLGKNAIRLVPHQYTRAVLYGGVSE